MTRGGFTMLELVLATVLASLVLTAAIGMFSVMERTDRVLTERFEDVSKMTRVHQTLRRAMQTMVAEPSQEQGPGGGGETASSSANGRRALTEEEQARRSGDDEELPSMEEQGRIRTGVHRFAMGRLDPSGEDSEFDEETPQPWRLEVVLTQSPLPAQAGLGGPVRGAFDKVQTGNYGQYPIWGLQWTPIEPAGEPVMLIDDLSGAWFLSLVKEGWVAWHAADEERAYPRAVRVVLHAYSGEKYEWIFEPGTTVGTGP